MKVKVANYKDLSEIVAFAKSQHAKSTFEQLPFNPAYFRKTVVQLITHNNGDILLAVNDKGQIRGMLMAWHEPMTFNRQPYATDLHFVAEQGGDMLLRKFKTWAKERGCYEIGMASFNGLDEDRIEKLYNRLGFRTIGKTYRLELGR